ncbi:MAG: DUF4381 domain-containing protein [Colwellia sp.]
MKKFHLKYSSLKAQLGYTIKSVNLTILMGFIIFIAINSVNLASASSTPESYDSNSGLSQINSAQANPGQSQGLVLNDIHTPEPINDYPIALGWWLLYVSILFLAIYTIKAFLKNKRLNKNKKIALKALNENKNESIEDILIIVKWVAMQYHDRNTIAKLHGEGFLQFLIKGLPDKHQDKCQSLISNALESQYKLKSEASDKQAAKEHLNNFKAGAILWMSHALPPKDLSSKHTLAKKVSAKNLSSKNGITPQTSLSAGK